MNENKQSTPRTTVAAEPAFMSTSRMQQNRDSDPTTWPFLSRIRLAELEQAEAAIRRFAGRGARILEVGAGAGWQAKTLTEMGYDVAAIDLPQSNHAKQRIWPIVDFDGVHIPFPNASFDVVFSSNVLEHVTDMDGLNAEIARVLKPQGTAIHFVPTGLWRFLSLLAHYPALARDIASRLRPAESNQSVVARSAEPQTQPSRETTLQKVLRRSVPRVHGSEGSPIRELHRFSKAQWDLFFARHGWRAIEYARSAMILSGDTLLGDRLSMRTRRSIAARIGGSAHLYILKRASTSDQQKTDRLAYYERYYRDLMPPDHDARILDLGCGQGDLLRFLHKEGYRAVEGVDVDRDAISAIEPMDGVTVSQAKANAEFLRGRPAGYDAIIMKQMIYYISRSDVSEFVRAAADALKPSGRLIVEIFNGSLASASLTEAKDHGILTRYTEHSLRALLETNGFRVEHISGVPHASPGLRSGLYYTLRSMWMAVWTWLLVLERGKDEGLPKIHEKYLLALGTRR